MLTRRELMARGALLALAPAACRTAWPGGGTVVNDLHSRLNATRVRELARPESADELAELVTSARGRARAVSVSGGRHAMGGQQFVRNGLQIDMSGFEPRMELDARAGILDASAGAQWPEIVSFLRQEQRGRAAPWAIIQKQTGADRLSLGGSLAANGHGRGLTRAPLVADVESFSLMNSRGELLSCSRTENAELFRQAIGGYGLFGLMTRVQLRLEPRRKLRRTVEVMDAAQLMERFEERIAEGYTYGDFQYSTDIGSDTLLRKGVFSCYRPVAPDTPMPAVTRELSSDDWLRLIRLAHLDRGQAFERYAGYYRTTDGQIYESDTHQLSTYIDDYHRVLGTGIGALATGTEMISEVYVPRPALGAFLEAVRADFLQHDVNLIYGTIRLIERDAETALAWAREPWVCTIFNLHTQHDAASLARTAGHFRRLIERGRELGGSYFLTYHRWASPDQVLGCYPQLPEVLQAKRRLDPDELFQSEWYRHYRTEFASSG